MLREVMGARYLLLFFILKYVNSERTCEPIRVEQCRNLGYNVTGMPNFVGHELQSDAEFTLQTYSPLIQYGCSTQLRFFLCSVFVPMCTEKVPNPIGPCRGLCESVRARCYPVLQGFGFPWPVSLNCSKFPAENNHEHMCMEGPGEVGPGPPLSKTVYMAAPLPTAVSQRPTPSSPCCHYARPGLYVYVNRSGRCSQMCDAHVLFSPSDKNLAEVWFIVWAAVCFISTLLALLTCLIDGTRVKYPEKPLAFLALCYNLASIGYGVRALAGRSAVACNPDPEDVSKLLLAQDGLGNANCAVVFLLLYYFGTASSVWWVVLTVTWCLSARFRWKSDRIQQHSSLFHLAGWGLPAVQTIAVLVLRDVDADELTGTCYVGNQSLQSLLVFVLAPHLFYLLLGIAIMMTGLLGLLQRMRRRMPPTISVMRRNGIDSKQEATVARLGVFAALYIVPGGVVAAALVYEYVMRDSWLRSTSYRPAVWVFLLRIFMSLVVGVTSFLSLWSPKTVRTWRSFILKLGPYRAAPVKCHPIQYYNPQPLVQRVHTHHKPHRKHRCNKHGSETTV